MAGVGLWHARLVAGRLSTRSVVGEANHDRCLTELREIMLGERLEEVMTMGLDGWVLSDGRRAGAARLVGESTGGGSGMACFAPRRRW